MNATLSAEVAVIGGGPAGAITALALAKLGRSVLLCEASDFPRDHVGISLSAGVRQQLAFVGLEGLLDRPVHRQGIPIKRRWDGEAFEPAAGSTAIVADRGVFDTDLLNAARHKAVHVLQPASVRALGQAGDVWRLDVRSPDSDLVVEARFVIDATGRRTQFRRRQRHGAATLALCGRWLGPQVEAVRISAQSASWCWGAPTGPDESVLVCFVDPLEFRRAPGTVLDRYLELARVSEVLPDIDSLTLAGVPLTCDATAYVTNGETAGLLRVGDADVALDPLSSSGVQAAIQSALAAGPIVNTLLTPGEDGIAALEFWRSRRASRMFQHRRWTRQFYRDAFLRHSTSFWADRCGDAPDMAAPATTTPLPHPDQSIVLSEGARLVLAPCLTGTLVKRLGCVEHVNLPEPVAFVAGIHVPPLLLQASRPAPAREILAAWSASLAPGVACSLLGWAWRHDILKAAEDQAPRARQETICSFIGPDGSR